MFQDGPGGLPTDSPRIPSPRWLVPVRSLQNARGRVTRCFPVSLCRQLTCEESRRRQGRGDGRSSVPTSRPVSNATAIRTVKRRVRKRAREENVNSNQHTHNDTATRRPPSIAPSGCLRTGRGALPNGKCTRLWPNEVVTGSSAPSSASRQGLPLPLSTAKKRKKTRIHPDDQRPVGRVEFRGPTLRAHPFTSGRFHVLLNSLFKVLFNFPSRYLSAIGLVTVFSLRWSLPPTLGCILKQPDSWDARSRRVPRQ